MLTKYNYIVFDLGGVVLDIDRDNCVRHLEAIGLTDAGSMLDLYCQSGDFLALEEGLITAGEFFDSLRAKAGTQLTDAMTTEALCAFITALPPERLKALRLLRKQGKRLFVLSNTNPIMYHSVIDRLFRQEGLSIRDYFDGEILSFQEKVCKPKPEIFEILKRRYNLDGRRTLFLDDSVHNCEAARACGIDAEVVTPDTDFIEILGINRNEL